jgi:uncharacterized membrane protein YkoI
MQASHTLPLKHLLSSLAIALVFATPCAFAKKDLFANDPAANQAHPSEQLVTTPVPEAIKEEAASDSNKTDEHLKTTATDAKSTEQDKENKKSYIELQLLRLKGHLVEAKEDIFGGKKNTQKEVPAIPTELSASESSRSSEEAKPEIPTISAAEAAQHAQALTEGQVINVRKYMEEEKPRYAVKLLQKNGRMKTINLDAVNGELIEETPQ